MEKLASKFGGAGAGGPMGGGGGFPGFPGQLMFFLQTPIFMFMFLLGGMGGGAEASDLD